MVQSSLGVPVSSTLLTGRPCWYNEAVDFASLVLQLPEKIWFMRLN